MEQSATEDSNEATNGAEHAIDLDLDTYSYTAAGSDGTSWLKVNLDRVHCVEQVVWYRNDGTPMISWTCTDTDCSNCVGFFCYKYTLTVSTEGAVSDLSPVSDCKYGDTVKLEKVVGTSFNVYEIAIVGKPGKLYTLHIQHNDVCTLYITKCVYRQ